ncbi:MAG: MarR family transcriptional regulator [Candidatus Hydrogenedentes bacterium]|nr:MarR family transcriptional regulator [Candidatus Hydrogenedentota bacterium]
MNSEEKMELARIIHATERRLHRFCVSRFGTDAENCLPLPALTFPQVNMIMTVRDAQCVTLKQLSEALCVKSPAVSAMVDRLVEMGLLTRSENPADRREVLIRISPAHEITIGELERRGLQVFVELVDRVGPDFAQDWRALSLRIQQVLDEAQGPNPANNTEA